LQGTFTSDLGQFCWYTSDSEGDRIQPAQTKIFQFNATADTDDSCRNWTIETKDTGNNWLAKAVVVAVDAQPPVTEKEFIGPQKEENGVEWIDGVTTIVLNPTDPEPHPSGVKATYWRNTLVPDNFCSNPQEFCKPLPPPQNQTVTVTFNATNDTYVKEDDNTTNFGSADKMFVTSEDTAPSKNRRALVRFNLSSIPSGAVIQSATLKLFMNNAPGSSRTHQVHRVTADWEEKDPGGVTWNTQPSVDGLSSSNITGTTNNVYVRWNVTADVQGFVNGSFPNYGWRIKDSVENESPKKEAEYRTREWSNASQRPMLEIVYTLSSGSPFNLYTGPIQKNEESCHMLEFYSVDNMNNTEQVRTNCFFVDKTPPTWNKEVGEPKQTCEGSECNWFVSPQTDITFTCTDQQPHPSGDEELCFFVSFDDPQNPDLTSKYCSYYGGTIGQDGFCCVAVGNGNLGPLCGGGPCDYKQFVFNFQESSFHDLKSYCKDAVDKKSETDIELFKVDATPPVITKTIVGPHIGDCNPADTNSSDGECIINGATTIHVEATDPEPHPAGGVQCIYNYTVDGVGGQASKDPLIPPFDLQFPEESTHLLTITCSDALGNEAVDREIFLVDKRPPVTTKTFIGPNKTNETGVEWIDVVTLVNLTAVDPQPHPSGANLTFYQNQLLQGESACQMPDLYCNPESLGLKVTVTPECINAVQTGCAQYEIGSEAWLACITSTLQEVCAIDITGWTPYTGPFNKSEESCHALAFFSIDNIGNLEGWDPETGSWEPNVNCFFVDDTPPSLTKVVGEPKLACENNPACEWLISQQTPIHLSCKDQEPHPVDHEVLFWRDYLINESAPGFSNSTDGAATIYKQEDSIHVLEAYCADALGNAGPVDREIFAVDTQPPVITKTIVGPHIGDCNPADTNSSDGECIINGATTIHVEATDPEPHPAGGVQCIYNYTVDGVGGQASKDPLIPPFDLQFPEESTHLLTITCRDGLGNTVSDVEIFKVDKTPPVTSKEYEGPQFSPDQNVHDSVNDFISTETDIKLSANDKDGPHDSGVNATYWRITLVGDTYCNGINEEINDTLDCNNAQGSGSWNLYSNPFQISQQSCHLIEYYSVDNVDKTETPKRQCAFVDNTAPLPNKTVGQISEIWDGKDANFYNISDKCWATENGIECWKVTTLTPITLDCNDQQPHPVDHENVYFNVNLDGDDVTEKYCDEFNGQMQQNGFCLVSEEAPITFYFREETEHNLQFYCADALGNTGPIDEEKFKVEGTMFNITINKKWNLISTPFVLLNDSMHAVFDPVGDKVKSVWTYDPTNATCGTAWCIFTPDGVPNDNLNSMLPGSGYWVLANNSTVLVIGGSLFSPIITPPDKTVLKGWNLIGYYGLAKDESFDPIDPLVYDGPNLTGDGRQAKCALGTLVGWQTLSTYWEPDNPDVWKFLNFTHTMNPGAGYWLFTNENENQLYTFSTTCPSLP